MLVATSCMKLIFKDMAYVEKFSDLNCLIKQIRNSIVSFLNVNHKFIINLNHGFQ